MLVVGVTLSLGTAWWVERSRTNRLSQQLELNVKLVGSGEPLALSRGTAVTIYAHEGQVKLKFSAAEVVTEN